jgi:Ni/Co efflux regulator RcnB
MNRLLVTSACLLVLLVGGCNANPAAAPGPQGPPGPQGVSERDRDRDRDRNRDQDRNREQDRDRNRDQGRQDQSATCPPGEHQRSDNGRTICVRD